ncbi:MAG: hypothetical protein LBB53_02600 [Prevotellaceae bacterium]|jgi:hypothetical protein|nr:hypothetical protein [Prevotellaceae bacterium]
MKNVLFEIKELWQIFINSIYSGFILKIEAVKLRLAIWLSDLRQKAYNKRFFVVLATVGIRNGKKINRLRSICNSEFKAFKRLGYLPKKMSYLQLSEKCFYKTDLKRNNTENYAERQRAQKKYLHYQKMFRKF